MEMDLLIIVEILRPERDASYPKKVSYSFVYCGVYKQIILVMYSRIYQLKILIILGSHFNEKCFLELSLRIDRLFSLLSW